MNHLRTVTIAPNPIQQIGEGVQGQAYVFTTPEIYVVKRTWRNEVRDREKKVHKDIFVRMSPKYRKYIPEPVQVRGRPEMYAMVFNYGVVTLREYCDELFASSKKSAKRQDKTKGRAIATALLDIIREAIFAIWATGYLHTDLHADNILVSKDFEKDGLVKIIDFGLAKKSPLPLPSKLPSTMSSRSNPTYYMPWIRWYTKSLEVMYLDSMPSNPNTAFWLPKNMFDTRTEKLIQTLMKMSKKTRRPIRA
jgi:serine/threonine protein kinase